jgi:hypothetical protein
MLPEVAHTGPLDYQGGLGAGTHLPWWPIKWTNEVGKPWDSHGVVSGVLGPLYDVSRLWPLGLQRNKQTWPRRYLVELLPMDQCLGLEARRR